MKVVLYLVAVAGGIATAVGLIGSFSGYGIFAWLLTLIGVFLALGGFASAKVSEAHKSVHERERLTSAERNMAEQLAYARQQKQALYSDPHAAEAAAVKRRKMRPRRRPRRRPDGPSL